MKAYELARLMEGCDADADVFVKDAEGMLHDFRIETRPATFDGFDTVYEEGLDIVMTD